jgi:hypothetical protein
MNVEVVPNRDKNVFQLFYSQECRGSAAEVDGVGSPFERSAHLFCGFRGLLDFGAQSRNELFEHCTRKDVGSKVAVGALGPAKRHGNVQSERHWYDYRSRSTGQVAVSNQHSGFSQEELAMRLRLEFHFSRNRREAGTLLFGLSADC